MVASTLAATDAAVTDVETAIRALTTLHLAGIIRRQDALRQKNWAITDPHVAWGLVPLIGDLDSVVGVCLASL